MSDIRKKRDFYILCQFFYCLDKKRLSIGGIETYIYNLCKLIDKEKGKATVIQYSDINFQIELEHCKVYGVDVKNVKTIKNKNVKLIEKFEELSNKDSVLIYATEQLAVKRVNNYTISIQHGVSWDIQSDYKVKRIQNILNIIKRGIRAVEKTKFLTYADKLICVDYNFINWYRTQIKYPEVEYEVIPNFTIVPKELPEKHKDENITILFARRFQTYRGTRIFANAIEKVLKNENLNVNVIFAGNGPDKSYLEKKFKNNFCVKFIQYNNWESLEIHKNVDIAVIPTIGSEGTSLSLLEAMASKCAVICTNVGGMTNIILDGFNGIMINPNESELYDALIKLIISVNLRQELSMNAYETVKKSFSLNKWEMKWKNNLFRENLKEY